MEVQENGWYSYIPDEAYEGEFVSESRLTYAYIPSITNSNMIGDRAFSGCPLKLVVSSMTPQDVRNNATRIGLAQGCKVKTSEGDIVI